MNYPVKTLAQIRPLLQGFRKAAGLTQAAVAERLGVTQQTYARLEANPASASLERLFRVMRVLGIEMTLAEAGAPASTDAAEPPAPYRDPAAAGEHRDPASRRTRKKAPIGSRRPRDTPHEDW